MKMNKTFRNFAVITKGGMLLKEFSKHYLFHFRMNLKCASTIRRSFDIIFNQ